MNQFMQIEIATELDAEEILELQKKAYLSEAEIYCDYSIPPLTQTIQELKTEFKSHSFYVARMKSKIVGSVNIRIENSIGHIGRIIVSPEKQGEGIGGKLLSYAEKANSNVRAYELFTGHKSEKNLAIYHHKGYREFSREKINDNLTFIHMRKPNKC